MTPISIAYFVLGLVALFWPAATLLFKRHVLGAQWLMMTALALVGLSCIIYSTFFNTFLMGEYILVVLYMLLTMAAAPMTQMAVTSLTRPQGVSRTARTLILPMLAVGVMMAASIVIGGADMYRLWIMRGTEKIAYVFYHGSWRYNLIVAVHFYLYWAVLVAEVLFVAIYTVRAISRFHKVLDEYYTSETVRRPDTMLFYIAVSINCIAIVLSYIIYPFNRPRPLWAVVVFCVVQGVAMFVMGYLSYRTSYGAERMRTKMTRRRMVGSNDTAKFAHELSQYVEKEGHYLDPDISVFLLAEHFHCSQDDVVDAVHKVHGTRFSDYIDGLRFEQATAILLAEPSFDPEDEEQMSRLAHRCGFLGVDALQNSFQREAHVSIAQWLEQSEG